MAKLKNLECTVNTASGPLPEYFDAEGSSYSEQEFPTKTVYIPAKDGEKFTIKMSVHSSEGLAPEANSITLQLVLDGVAETNSTIILCPANYSYPKSQSITGDDELHAGRWIRRSYHFSRIEVREEAAAEPNGIIDESMGEVKVVVLRYAATSPTATADEKLRNDKTKVVVDERTMKGKDATHSVSLSVLENSQDQIKLEWWDGECIDSEEMPYAVFKFRYRSEACLKEMGLIDRSPAPSPALSPSPGPSPVLPLAPLPVPSLALEAEKGLRPIEKMSKDEMSGELGLHRVLLKASGLKSIEQMSKEEIAGELGLHRVLMQSPLEAALQKDSSATPVNTTPIKREEVSSFAAFKIKREGDNSALSGSAKRRKSRKEIVDLTD